MHSALEDLNGEHAISLLSVIMDEPAISKPSPKYTSTTFQSSVSVSVGLQFQNLLLTITLPTQRALCHGRPEKCSCRFPSSVSLPFDNHLLSIILPIQRALSLGKFLILFCNINH